MTLLIHLLHSVDKLPVFFCRNDVLSNKSLSDEFIYLLNAADVINVKIVKLHRS